MRKKFYHLILIKKCLFDEKFVIQFLLFCEFFRDIFSLKCLNIAYLLLSNTYSKIKQTGNRIDLLRRI